MDVDIERLIDWEAESSFGFEDELYDYDLSGITVEVLGFERVGTPSSRPVKLQVIDVIDVTSCSSVAQPAAFPEYSEAHTESFTVAFSGKVSWGQTISGEIGIPDGITVGGARTMGIDLAAEGSRTTTSTKEVRQAGSDVTIPPCKRVRATREIWRTEASGRIRARLRIHGRVTYKVQIDNWPDPTYSQDLDFIETIEGDYTAVGGYEIRGTYHETAATCPQPCTPPTAGACRLTLGDTQVAAGSLAPAGVAFRPKVTVAGVAGATLGQPFPIEGHEQALTLEVTMVADHGTFTAKVGTSALRVPLVPQQGVRKLTLPVTCRLPGEVAGVEDKEVVVTVVQAIKLELLPG